MRLQCNGDFLRGKTTTRGSGDDDRHALSCFLGAIFFREVPMHEGAHVLERFQRHDFGNDDRARQRPAPVGVGTR